MGTTGTFISTRSPLPKVTVTGTKLPAVNEPVTGMPPFFSVARLTRPPSSISIGEKESAWMVLPPAPASDSTVAFSSVLLLEKVAMKVPESSCPDTITAPSTSTWASRLLTPDAGV